MTGTFELVVTGTSYIVAYRLQPEEGADAVQVLTVLHAARAWPKTL